MDGLVFRHSTLLFRQESLWNLHSVKKKKSPLLPSYAKDLLSISITKKIIFERSCPTACEAKNGSVCLLATPVCREDANCNQYFLTCLAKTTTQAINVPKNWKQGWEGWIRSRDHPGCSTPPLQPPFKLPFSDMLSAKSY
ncbi:hypothetical protein CEXT_299021 [Caerostris extrusa]|uniref:Notch ligand N-terminal domain-containing protein n=1 Tax=Caerostris extrusa TaxID=172846 RepID=A0AAV4V3M1_CAEEX|nr:hypothetical protein CEXT_299021 [Caerostris extrusa]